MARGHTFLIFKYCRMSGNDMTVSSPRAAAAAMVTAVMYPSVRIVCLLSFRARSAAPQHHDDEHDDHDHDDGSDADKHGVPLGCAPASGGRSCGCRGG